MIPQSVSLRHISKSFAGTEVLRDISLEIRAGEFLSLVGMSGCGKSTLLRLIAGLEQPDSGEVRIGEREVTREDPSARNLAMVFQSYALYPHMTVAENIATPLRMRRLSAWQRLPLLGRLMPGRAAALAEIRQQASEAADLLQIGHLADRRPAQLSGGQRQRVALARALVRAPAAFLMDEPLSNLDARLRAHMRAELAALHRRLGATFIYVTHDQVEAMTMSDRIALMEGGRILQLGTPEELYARPASLSVARFIGTPQINLLPAEADASGEVSVQGYRPGLRVAGGRQSLTLGLRPEDLRPAAQGITLRAGHSEMHGADRYVTLTPPAEPELRLTLRCQGAEVAPAEGSLIRVAPDPARIHLFDAAGQRLEPQFLPSGVAA